MTHNPSTMNDETPETPETPEAPASPASPIQGVANLTSLYNRNEQDTPVRKRMSRIPSGIKGLDELLRGGLPASRPMIVCGSAGSGKTVLCSQFLYRGAVDHGEAGVFVSFEEAPEIMRDNLRGFGWDVEDLERRGLWTFVDGTLQAGEEEQVLGGNFSLEGLRARVRHAIEKTGAKRVAVDSLATLFMRFPHAGVIRRELTRFADMLREAPATGLLTAELQDYEHDQTRFGVEEYVGDGVIVLRHDIDQLEQRHRTLEIVKLRGADHATGRFPFSIDRYDGVSAVSVGSLLLSHPSSEDRIRSGNPELDAMLYGGLFRDSVTIIAGATGTGKTLTATQFIDGARQAGERAVFLGYEESRSQLIRNAKSWGVDFKAMEDEGNLQIHCQYPETASLAQHLSGITDLLVEYRPQRLVIDSLSAFRRIGNEHAFRSFMISLTAIIKQLQIAGLYTVTSDRLYGAPEATTQNVSTLTDSIILLRYLEDKGGISRALGVLKMRGSGHDSHFRRFTISDAGMTIGDRLDASSRPLSSAGT